MTEAESQRETGASSGPASAVETPARSGEPAPVRVEVGGARPRSSLAKGLTLGVALLALGALTFSIRMAERRPSTDDAAIDAEVVHVAPDVGGRVVELNVAENGYVKKGDLILRIDPEPYELTVRQMGANLALAEAALVNRRKLIETQSAGADISAEQTRRAKLNQDLAQRTVDRLRPLAGKSYVPYQQYDQALTTLRNAEASLAEARRQEAAARQGVNTDADAVASVDVARASLAQAERSLRKTRLIAPQNGRVVGLQVLAGEILAPGQGLFTLVATDEWLAVGSFREFELKHIKPGDCATVFSMIDRSRSMRGKVESVGFGVSDADRINLPRGLPIVQKQLNWVRVAQRFPVRVRLEEPPEDLMRVGASALIRIGDGDSCK